MIESLYERFCATDSVFYDDPVTQCGNFATFSQAKRSCSDGWRQSDEGDWRVWAAPEARLPAQGWKVHVSATLGNADEVLAVVMDFCVAHGLAFKFIPNRELLLLANSKYADRGASGKFATIYTRTEDELEFVVRKLGERLAGQTGPYILSDLRWTEGPLFVRYGGFVSRFCMDETGERRLAIARPDGVLVPDIRGPSFSVPDWVELPGFLKAALAQRNTVITDEMPYTVERVLHFSNGGGIYLARDTRNSVQVVLKEARPHAGLDSRGTDAIARLRNERDVLRRLEGVEGVPRALDYRTLGEHEFLVQTFVVGTVLSNEIAPRHPLITAPVSDQSDTRALADYVYWVRDICGRVEKIIAELHSRDVVHGDVHMGNIMVGPDGALTLFDFEIACAADAAGFDAPRGLRNQAFGAPASTSGYALDHYATACLRVALFLPLTALLALDQGKIREFIAAIVADFPVDPGFFDAAARTIAGENSPPTNDDRASESVWPISPRESEVWPALREKMAKAIYASATPERTDRLFPGHIEQFGPSGVGGLGLSHGAAGVLYALAATGVDRRSEHEAWLIDAALSRRDNNCDVLAGLYDGLHGVAFTLYQLGYHDRAFDVLDCCCPQHPERLGTSLYNGLAGIGLCLLHISDSAQEKGARQQAEYIGELLATRLGRVEDVGTVSGGRYPKAGLMYGSSGSALLFLRLYEHTGEVAYLDRAEVALRQDLRRCRISPDGSLKVNEGRRVMSYLSDGGVGIGIALAQYLRHRSDPELHAAVAAIQRNELSRYFVLPGLFHGLAGIVYALALRDPATSPDSALLDQQVRRLGVYHIPYRGGIAFPGEGLMRLSMDLATGTAGVLLAVGAALADGPVRLPLLDAATSSDGSRVIQQR